MNANDYWESLFPHVEDLDIVPLREAREPLECVTKPKLPFFLKAACIFFASAIALFSCITFLLMSTPQSADSPSGGYFVYAQNTVPQNAGKPDVGEEKLEVDKDLEETTDTLETIGDFEEEFEAQASEQRLFHGTQAQSININGVLTEAVKSSTLPRSTTLPVPFSSLPSTIMTELPGFINSTKKKSSVTTSEVITKNKTAADSQSTSLKSSATQKKKTTTSARVNTLIFTTYGYGHGVGMSQQGASAMARSGSTYEEILLHYYPGTSLTVDKSPPTYVRFGGDDYSLTDYLARTAEAEIGSQAHAEAFKAQVVAAYTFAKQRNFSNLSRTVQAFSNTLPSESSLRRVRSVLGMKNESSKPMPSVLTQDGKVIFAPFFASCAGKTTDVTSVWGGSLSSYPYLSGKVSSPEQVSIVETCFSIDDFKNYISAYNKKNPEKAITLGSDPKKWISITSHDSAVSKNVGYVAQIKIGNQTMSGYAFRYEVLGLAIHSHCFTLSFA